VKSRYSRWITVNQRFEIVFCHVSNGFRFSYFRSYVLDFLLLFFFKGLLSQFNTFLSDWHTRVEVFHAFGRFSSLWPFFHFWLLGWQAWPLTQNWMVRNYFRRRLREVGQLLCFELLWKFTLLPRISSFLRFDIQKLRIIIYHLRVLKSPVLQDLLFIIDVTTTTFLRSHRIIMPNSILFFRLWRWQTTLIDNRD
jgi:hypothetical protein